MFLSEPIPEEYGYLKTYTRALKQPERPIIGRDMEMRRIMAAMVRPELCNVILLAEAGSGKTALVQGTMMADKSRYYLEVDLSHMIADLNDVNQMADRLKRLFEEVQLYRDKEKKELVLFMDEFHQIVQMSSAAVEALKPILADSGARGIRVIAATTFREFQEYVAPNQPLVERLQRINLAPPDKKMVVQILKGMAERYGVERYFYSDRLFELIYEYTERYVPSSAQPRKSIRVFDAMIGWNRFDKRKLNTRLLADVLFESDGINVAFRVDASSIKKELDAHVFAQDLATRMIEQRLQLCVADLHDKDKPMSSFLFCGSTGVGKGLPDDLMIPVWTPDGSGPGYKRNGDLEVGDYVFSRTGEPEQVVGVFHQGLRDVYRVTFTDGRETICDSNHLWAVYPTRRSREDGPAVYSVETMLKRGVATNYRGKPRPKYVIPMNQPVQWPARVLAVHPYVMGAAIAFRGGHEYREVSNREHIQKKFRRLYGSRTFSVENSVIPVEYMTGSVEQRWELIQGLFDVAGCVRRVNGDMYGMFFTACERPLAQDVQRLLWSMGVRCHICPNMRNGKFWDVRITCPNSWKPKFFSVPEKLAVVKKAAGIPRSKQLDFNHIGIKSIEKLPEQMETTCIYVADGEHLYQTDQFVVTHNTEVTKQLARILFDDSRRLIRMDMTEFANAESLERFRKELTTAVWERPFSIVLLDEIEKACPEVTRLLLQVLDDGRLMDANNKEVPFTNCYIVLTTNAGSEIYKMIAQYEASDTGSGEVMAKYNKLIRESISSTQGDNKFPPELLGRIDTIVPFQPLSRETQRKIVINKLQKLRDDVLSKHGMKISFTQDVVRYIVNDNLDTDSDSGGARAALSKLDSEVVALVARFINENPDAEALVVSVKGAMASDNKRLLESDARIVVTHA